MGAILMPTVRLNNLRGIASRLRDDDARMQPGREDGMFVRTVNDGYVTTDGAVEALPDAQTLDDGTWGAMISAPAGLIAHDKDNDTLVLNPQTETPSTLVSSVGASVAFLEHQ